MASVVKKRWDVLAAGLALFSMFFGAGDLIWPLILGGDSGNMNGFAVTGLLLTGVSLPLLGLIAMMLFRGNYHAFFGQTGKITGCILIFLIQAILGPFGSLPRLFTLSYATLKPYLFEGVTLLHFSIIAAVIVFLFTVKRHKIVDILGYVLCPILLLALGAILVVGFINPHATFVAPLQQKEAFFNGLNVGYNTLDLIASFIFAPLVLTYFQKDSQADEMTATRSIFKKMVKSSLLAALLLSLMYLGLTFVSSFYTPHLPAHNPEERLAAISCYLLGKNGAFFSCIAVALSCLTTAIPISIISAEYIQKDLTGGKWNFYLAAIISLAISAAMANLGFMGIATFLSPILQILCPGLIILSILNIMHKLYEMRMKRFPVYAAFALSMIGYLARI